MNTKILIVAVIAGAVISLATAFLYISSYPRIATTEDTEPTPITPTTQNVTDDTTTQNVTDDTMTREPEPAPVSEIIEPEPAPTAKPLPSKAELKVALLEKYDWMDDQTADNVALTGSAEFLEDDELIAVLGGSPLFVSIVTTGSWEGATRGTDFVNESTDGFGYGVNILTCEAGGTYAVTYQKDTPVKADNMLIVVYQYGEVLKTGYTSADYGVVSIAGTCARLAD